MIMMLKILILINGNIWNVIAKSKNSKSALNIHRIFSSHNTNFKIMLLLTLIKFNYFAMSSGP